jgi:hypothetical protein
MPKNGMSQVRTAAWEVDCNLPVQIFSWVCVVVDLSRAVLDAGGLFIAYSTQAQQPSFFNLQQGGPPLLMPADTLFCAFLPPLALLMLFQASGTCYNCV